MTKFYFYEEMLAIADRCGYYPDEFIIEDTDMTKDEIIVFGVCRYLDTDKIDTIKITIPISDDEATCELVEGIGNDYEHDRALEEKVC